MRRVEHKEGWEPKNRCFWTVVLEKTLESPLDCKIQRVNAKGNPPWIFTGRTDAEALILRPPDAKSQLTGKDPDTGKDWGQEKWVTEDEMVGWRHWLNGHEFEQALGAGEGQGSLACCTHGLTKSPTFFSDWITTKKNLCTLRNSLKRSFHSLIHSLKISSMMSSGASPFHYQNVPFDE